MRPAQVDLATSVQSRTLVSGTSAPADIVASLEALLLQLLQQVSLICHPLISEITQTCMQVLEPLQGPPKTCGPQVHTI